jgi:hypothetical protein
MTTKTRGLLFYAILAVLPALLQSHNPPADAWGWFQWIGNALYQAALAAKAFLSTGNIVTDLPAAKEIQETAEKTIEDLTKKL